MITLQGTESINGLLLHSVQTLMLLCPTIVC